MGLYQRTRSDSRNGAYPFNVCENITPAETFRAGPVTFKSGLSVLSFTTDLTTNSLGLLLEYDTSVSDIKLEVLLGYRLAKQHSETHLSRAELVEAMN